MDYSELSDETLKNEYERTVSNYVDTLKLIQIAERDNVGVAEIEELEGQKTGIEQIQDEIEQELRARGFKLNRKHEWAKGESCPECEGAGGWDDLDNTFYECWLCGGTGLY